METELTRGHGASLVPEGDRYTPWGILRGGAGRTEAGRTCAHCWRGDRGGRYLPSALQSSQEMHDQENQQAEWLLRAVQ